MTPVDLTRDEQMQRHPLATRVGFTLVEVIVAAVILSLLAAVTVPQVMDAIDKKRVQDSYDILVEIQGGITNTLGTGFIDVVRTGASATNTSMMPGKVSELSEPIQSNQLTTYPNACGANAAVNTTFGAFSGANATSGTSAQTTWTIGGPFIHRVVSQVDGLALPIGQLQNTILRTITSVTAPPMGATGATTAQWIRLRINNVDGPDQVALDLLVDGVAGTNVGRVQYVAGGTTIDYLIAVPNRC
jgi:prepilin-type N-terminal cleavage/methylation domain-containing protein